MGNFQDFSKFSKNSKIYSLIPFQRHIKRKNRTIFTAEPQKTLKNPFWPYSLQNKKNKKIRHTIPQVFSIPFQQKKNFENRTTTGRCLGGGGASSRHINLSLPVY